jgi:MerR family transcriptional regulator, copper efflux regulator
MENLQSYMLINEAAEFIGVSVGTMRNWVRDGKLKAHRNPVNGYRLFKKKDLEALLRKIEKPVKRRK